MLFKQIENISLESFRRESQGKRLVFLYPFTHYRTLFLRSFLERGDRGLVYHQVPRDGLTLVSWLQALSADLRRLFPGFGDATAALGVGDDPQALGRALAADLNAAFPQPTILFIDDFDRLKITHDLERFIQALIAALPDGAQIALSASLVVHQPWMTLLTSGHAAVLGYQEERRSLTFTPQIDPKPQLEVHALDGGAVWLNGESITAWDGLLPKLLFHYLIDHPFVTRDEIFADFWPNSAIKDATDIFHVTKHKVTEVLSRRLGRAFELTQYKQGFYLPCDKVVRSYDAVDFEDAVDRGLQTVNDYEAEVLLRRAIDYYRQPFLVGLSMPWVIARRDQLANKYSDAVIGLASVYWKRGAYAEALPLYEQSLKLRPEREDIYHRLIAYYLDVDQPACAADLFAQMQAAICEKLAIPLSAASKDLQRRLQASLDRHSPSA